MYIAHFSLSLTGIRNTLFYRFLLALDLSPADGDGGTVGRGQLAEHHVHPDVFQEGVEVGVGVDLPGVTKV